MKAKIVSLDFRFSAFIMSNTKINDNIKVTSNYGVIATFRLTATTSPCDFFRKSKIIWIITSNDASFSKFRQ